MTKSKRNSHRDRRESVLESLQEQHTGEITTFAAKQIAKGLNGVETVCRITKFCRTTVFEFPGCQLISQNSVSHHVICDSKAFRAIVVSDLEAYYRNGYTTSPHYEIDASLRDGVAHIHSKARGNAHESKVQLFLVTEQYEDIPPTTFDSGECFLIDEVCDGVAAIKGGRQGEQALLAFKTANGSWPKFVPDMQAVNTVLAAVKVEQNVSHHITEHYSCRCFVSEDRLAVYSIDPTVNIVYGGFRAISQIDVAGLVEKVARVQSLYQGLSRDSVSTPQMAELIDSVLLDKTRDEGHYRLWYLRLCQAILDSKRVLEVPQFENMTSAVSGKYTPKELKEYRNRIAHWWTGKVDFSFVEDIQLTVLELLRRKYSNRD